jgi:hypothetical protein
VIVASIGSLPTSDDILKLLRRIYVQSSTLNTRKQGSEFTISIMVATPATLHETRPEPESSEHDQDQGTQPKYS